MGWVKEVIKSRYQLRHFLIDGECHQLRILLFTPYTARRFALSFSQSIVRVHKCLINFHRVTIKQLIRLLFTSFASDGPFYSRN